jgi:hypothetical protein
MEHGGIRGDPILNHGVNEFIVVGNAKGVDFCAFTPLWQNAVPAEAKPERE